MELILRSLLTLASLIMLFQFSHLALPIVAQLLFVIALTCIAAAMQMLNNPDYHNECEGYNVSNLSSYIFRISSSILVVTTMTSLISVVFGLSLASFNPYGLTFLCLNTFGNTEMRTLSAAMACLSIFMPLQAQALINPLTRYSTKALLSCAIVHLATKEKANNWSDHEPLSQDDNPSRTTLTAVTF